jgi:hypothetical protein
MSGTSRVAVLLVALVTLTVAPATEAEATPREAPKSATKVLLHKGLGNAVATWGYDLKQKCGPWNVCTPVAKRLAYSPRVAQQVFGSGRITMVRIPFRADAVGTTPDGHLDPAYLRHTVLAMRNIYAVNPRVTAYASRDTITDCGATRCLDFAQSLKVKGSVSTFRYGRLAAEYLEYMRGQGIRITHLGLENEPGSNEGNLTPTRLAQTIASVDRFYRPTLPKMVANDPANPQPHWWAKAGRSVTRRLDVAAIHSNPDRWAWRQAEGARETARYARKAGLQRWNTEFHAPGRDRLPFNDAARTLRSLFDQVDMGYTGFFWWGFRPREFGTPQARLQHGLVDSLWRSRVLQVVDRDGDSTRAGSLITRAYRQGRFVHLWIVNDTRRGVYRHPVWMSGRTATTARVERWTARGPGFRFTQGNARVSNGLARVDMPPRTITHVTIKIRA